MNVIDSKSEGTSKTLEFNLDEISQKSFSQYFNVTDIERKLEVKWSWLRWYLHIMLARLIRLESPLHYRFQQFIRTPMLDLIMQRLTLVGSTISFIIMIPFMFLVGGKVADFAYHFAILMSISVYVTNFFKDLLCLPRPSLPIERIDLIAKHSEEFGFPSCHTFLAIALGRLTLHTFFSHNSSDLLESSIPKWILICFLATIVLSRVYCGMHSVTDVLSGLVLGWFTGGVYIRSIPWLEHWINSATQLSCLTATTGLAFLLLGLIHPDPAWAGCPCFKDTLRVVGVIIGVYLSKVNMVLYPLGSQISVPLPETFADMFIRCLLGIGALAVFDLVVFKQIKKFLEPFFLPPKPHIKGTPFYLDRISFVIIGEVIKFFGIAVIASNLVPRVIFYLSI